MLKMTPRQTREEIEAIDQDLAELEPWEKKLVEMRKHYVLSNCRDVVTFIENGLQSGQGRPALTDLEPFDQGWPGLREARDEIAHLRERRELLATELPSSADDARSVALADAIAKEIRERAKGLIDRSRNLDALLNEAARLALPLLEEIQRVWDNNKALDKLAFDQDIARPSTPRPATPSLDVALPLSMLLRYLRGQEPNGVDPEVAAQIRSCCEAATVGG
jgi:hypothetical protein